MVNHPPQGARGPQRAPQSIPPGTELMAMGIVPCVRCDSRFTISHCKIPDVAIQVQMPAGAGSTVRTTIIKTRCLECLHIFTPEEADAIIKARQTKGEAGDPSVLR